jgi:hypothetical protein
MLYVNRRGFLGMLAGAVAAAAVGIKLAHAPPKLAALADGDLDGLRLSRPFGLLQDFEQRLLNQAMQRVAETVDVQMADDLPRLGDAWRDAVPQKSFKPYTINIAQPSLPIDLRS